MAPGGHVPQEASEDSLYEGHLHQLVDPAFSQASGPHSGSVYGGVAPSSSRPTHDYQDPYYTTARPSHDLNEQRHDDREPQHIYQATGYPSPPAFPPPSHSLSAPNSHHSNNLPSFSRWSPTRQSGGYSGDGRAYTTHQPPPSALEMQPRNPYPPHLYPHRAGSDEEEPTPRGRYSEADEEADLGVGGWVSEAPVRSEWEGAEGEYRHGVGYDSIKGRGKEEGKIADRVRRLEREFGEGRKTGPGGMALSMKQRIKEAKEAKKREKMRVREESGVDGKGRLVVLGAKKRAGLRWAQGLGAIVVGVGSVGASLVGRLTKPLTKPPPKGTAPLYILYLLPFISLTLTLYLFAIRPCMHRRRAASPGVAAPNQFVVPLLRGGVGSDGGGADCCCFGRGRKGRRGPRGSGGKYAQGGPTVNLVVDPSHFPALFQRQVAPVPETTREREKRKKEQRRRRRRKLLLEKQDGERDGGEDGLISSASSSSSSNSDDSSDAWSATEGPRSNQRKGILSAVALEGRWREARSWLKKVTWWDAGAGVIWLAVGVYAMGWGERCSPGGFQGFCNFYNTALAFAVLLAASFFLSLTLDILDLRRTRAPPRLRQQRV